MGQVALLADQGPPGPGPPLPAAADCAHTAARPVVKDEDAQISLCPSCGRLEAGGQVLNG